MYQEDREAERRGLGVSGQPSTGCAQRGPVERRTFPCLKDITGTRYRVTVYEDTGEATVSGILGRRSTDLYGWSEGSVPDGSGTDGPTGETRPFESSFELPQAETNAERAARRARVELRRYSVKNRLMKMLTFTYAGSVFDPLEVKADVNGLLSRWRKLKGDRAFPYLYVLELHPGGHGLHVHMAVPRRYISKHWLQETWGLGIVHYRDPKGLRNVDDRECSRRLSLYLAKYLSKDMESGRSLGQHRYEVAQGFAVGKVTYGANTLAEADGFLKGIPDENFHQVWSSSERDGWAGPPTWSYRSP